ncbi:malate dehydrogenase [Actinomycetospora sp. TBRC 11914]|uniref:malate dehydrogenase n=1 Tax=Actinomycetospora sp. TBRC 11914 TaxID=2729387 RepID=UPI00145E997C|nr:malate dehydrogenase [Actinomycetospora sp. TBRC 11914]NMO90971.1 malate dehydrogenase [Actinomycetospora sp. TBRC 11914]
MSTVWGTRDVEAAAQRGATLRLGPGDVLTPLARDRARELGVTIASADAADRPAAPPPPSSGTTDRTPPGSTSATTPATRRPGRGHPRPSPATPPVPALPTGTGGPVRSMHPPSGALFRRGAPLPSGLASPAPHGGGATGRVVVVGAGHVGMIAAMRLADADVFDELVLVDVDEGRAAGIALDLQHTAALADFATRVRGVATVAEAGPADYVVITAGRPRRPGMSRADLVSTNAEIVGGLARSVAATSPHAVVVVVTNPLDEMTQHAWVCSGFPSGRVVGMAGVLDTARFQALVALEGTGRAGAVEAIALGSHGEEMVIPLSRARAGGRALAGQVPAERLSAVVDRARGSGAEVVGLLRSGSAFLAPGTSAARMVLAMVRETGEVMSAAVLADGTYGISDVYLGLPVRLGRHGLREIVALDLSAAELTALREAGERIRKRVGSMARAS